ncbi:unnamed protein product [marine sediment metagenome]|uniref:Uncharacterized protein n=1 Tax=marine sediment metagenome TaxID=412755 RepID=X1M4K2_9ZZZZ
MPEEWATLANRPGCTSCNKCARRFVKGEEFCIRETQVSWFRGDDEVVVLCADCAKETP